MAVGSYSKFGGTIDAVDGPNLGGWDNKWSASGLVEWRPVDGLEASAFYYHYQDRLDGSANYIFTNNCGGTTSAMVNRGGSDRRYFCGHLTAADPVNFDPAPHSHPNTHPPTG